MKRFIRTCLIISGTLAALGVLFVIIGVSTGGVKVIKNDILNGNIGFNWTGSILVNDADVKGMKVYDGEKVSSKDVSSIEFNGQYGDFEITVWDKEGYALEGDSENTKIYYSLEEGKLKITPIGKEKGLIRNTVEGKLYIPKDAKIQNLSILVGAGTLSCSNVETEELSVTVGAGEGNFEGVKAMKADFDIGAGSSDIRKTSFGNTKFKVGMGELSMNGTVTENLDVDCGMGDVELKLMGRQTDYNYAVTVGAGAVKIGDKDFSGLRNKTEVDYNSDKTMTVKCGMGDTEIEFE